MKKYKFFIKGMHCTSCAQLIQKNIQELPGIISAKVNYSSRKAVAWAKDNKLTKDDLNQAVRQAGDYQIEKFEEENDDQSKSGTAMTEEDSFSPNYPDNIKGDQTKKSFFLGIATSIGVISVILNIVFANALFSDDSTNINKNSGTVNKTVNQNTNAQAANPTANPAKIQTFEITSADHVLGNQDAPVTLVEFSDFECPFCERAYPTFKKILENYKYQVRLVYKHFPLGFHPNAQKAAEASECAAEQGKFWEYHDKIFDNQSAGLSVEKFKQWAQDLELDAQKFNDCLDSGKYASQVQSDYQEGVTKGVNGTPATFVNGQLISGAVPYETFEQAIKELID